MDSQVVVDGVADPPPPERGNAVEELKGKLLSRSEKEIIFAINHLNLIISMEEESENVKDMEKKGKLAEEEDEGHVSMMTKPSDSLDRLLQKLLDDDALIQHLTTEFLTSTSKYWRILAGRALVVFFRFSNTAEAAMKKVGIATFLRQLVGILNMENFKRTVQNVSDVDYACICELVYGILYTIAKIDAVRVSLLKDFGIIDKALTSVRVARGGLSKPPSTEVVDETKKSKKKKKQQQQQQQVETIDIDTIRGMPENECVERMAANVLHFVVQVSVSRDAVPFVLREDVFKSLIELIAAMQKKDEYLKKCDERNAIHEEFLNRFVSSVFVMLMLMIEDEDSRYKLKAMGVLKFFKPINELVSKPEFNFGSLQQMIELKGPFPKEMTIRPMVENESTEMGHDHNGDHHHDHDHDHEH